MITVNTIEGMKITCSNMDNAQVIARAYKQHLQFDTVVDLKPVKRAVNEPQKLYCANYEQLNDAMVETIIKDNYSSFYNYEMSARDFISEHDFGISK